MNELVIEVESMINFTVEETDLPYEIIKKIYEAEGQFLKMKGIAFDDKPEEDTEPIALDLDEQIAFICYVTHFDIEIVETVMDCEYCYLKNQGVIVQ